MLGAIRAFKSPNIPKNYFRGEIHFLRVAGIEMERDETIPYKIFSYISIFTWTYLFTFVELYEFYASWGSDIEKLTQIFMYSMTHVNGAIKITMLFIKRKEFKRIIKILHEGFFKPDINRGGKDEFLLIRECVRKSERMLIFFTSCIASVYISAVIATIIKFIYKPREEWTMIFLPISIVNTTYSPNYEIALTYQHINIIMVALLVIGTDILLVSVIAHLSCQFKILQAAFKNCKERAMHLYSSSSEREMTFDECFTNIIHDSVRHHLAILDLAVEMEELCNMILLVTSLTAGGQLCFMLYQASLVEIGSLAFFNNLIYWFDISAQILLYCYVSDEVTTESVNVIDSVVEMDWVGTPIKAQKAMILVMARAYRPVYITAGKFVNFSLQMFMSIVKASFSYFMVLRQVNE